jgi:15-cis-phytoene synthase
VRILDKKFRAPIYAIYGFVRFADEIVDTFHDHDKQQLLSDFKSQTYHAIENKLSTNPILHSFQWVVNAYGIERSLIDAFLKSMEMDLFKKTFTLEEYQEYIYGSAEVVGLMCLRVFYKDQEDEYQKLLPAARKLGEAFQKVNFLRDLRSDQLDRGRIYFPEADFNNFTKATKDKIELEIWQDFQGAFPGIKSLHKEARLGVYLAYRYYLELLRKIQGEDPERLQEKRFSVSNQKKLLLLLKCFIRNKFGWI